MIIIYILWCSAYETLLYYVVIWNKHNTVRLGKHNPSIYHCIIMKHTPCFPTTDLWPSPHQVKQLLSHCYALCNLTDRHDVNKSLTHTQSVVAPAHWVDLCQISRIQTWVSASSKMWLRKYLRMCELGRRSEVSQGCTVLLIWLCVLVLAG